MKLLQQLKNPYGLKALVRVDYNVPVGADNKVDKNEAYRIHQSFETIKYLKDGGAKIILISHIGKDKKDSLQPVANYLKNFFDVKFLINLKEEEILNVVSNMDHGEIVMLENLRQNDGEEKNEDEFAVHLSKLADIYVNEAFSVNHRLHASIVGVPLYLPGYAGFWLQKEIANLDKVLKTPEKPFVFIVGGSKFDTKLPLIKKFETVSDDILIGGALANNFFKEIGFQVGKSLVDKNAEIMEFFKKENIKIPFDVVVKRGGQKELAKLEKDDVIVDMGKETVEAWSQIISSAKMVLWNGPLGLYEEGFDVASKKLIEVVATSNAFSIIGGGDTVKLVYDLGLENKISFVSTGGGAMLEYLGKGHLPGIDILESQISTDSK